MSRFSTDPRALVLVAGMAIGSVVMWLGVPFVWVLLAAQVSTAGHIAFGPFLMVMIGAPLTMIPVARALNWLDHRHQTLVGRLESRRDPAPWRQSMRDAGRREEPPSVLAVVMVLSVAIAGASFGIWFLFLAGSPPGSINSG